MAPDDLEVGQLVTIRDWYINHAQARDSRTPKDWGDLYDMYFGSGRSQPAAQRRDGMAHPYRVEGINYPFTILRDLVEDKLVMLDLRLAELTKITEEFCKLTLALHEQHRKKIIAPKKGKDGKLTMDEYFKKYAGGSDLEDKERYEEDDD